MKKQSKNEDLARALYEHHYGEAGDYETSGPSWDELPRGVREAWTAEATQEPSPGCELFLELNPSKTVQDWWRESEEVKARHEKAAHRVRLEG